MNKQNRLLLINQFRPDFTMDYMLIDGLKNLREELISDYPTMGKWLPKKLFDLPPIFPERMQIMFRGYNVSTPGHFLSSNLTTPTKVLSGNVTPHEIVEELKIAKKGGFPYTHVGFSVYVTGYMNFIKSAGAVKEFDPNIITIAGNVGVLFPNTEKHVDFVGKGDGVPYLRELLGENTNNSYKLEIIPSKSTVRIYGIEMKTELAQIVTKLGCPNNCDFCVTRELFSGKFTKPFFTPQEVHDKLVEYRRKIKKEFYIMFSEPQGITNKKWWYELFDLFINETEDYPIIIPTSLASIKNFDLDRISKSSMRFFGLNIGIESFSKDYNKNSKHLETKQILKKLYDYGIGTYATFIIGFDHQTKEKIWDEIRTVVDLDLYGITVHNLKVLPQTPLWYEYEKAGRLLNVPYDFYYIEGFQAFTHPHFKPGFEDMLPLTYKIYEYIEKENPTLINLVELYKNLAEKKPHFQKRIKQYVEIASLIFEPWKKYLKPSDNQIENYLNRLGGIVDIPSYLNNLKDSYLDHQNGAQKAIYSS